MATYKMLQPGLANVIRDDGASIILPIDEQTAQAQGLTPEPEPGAMPPVPSGPNPYSMVDSGQVVAGPGGGPKDLGQGAGIYGEPPKPMDAGVVARQLLAPPKSTAHETRPEPSKFDVAAPHPAQDIAKGLVKAGTGAEQPEAPASGQPSMDPMFAQYINSGGGGGGPAKMRATSETRKYHEAGPVDPALSADIARRGDEVAQAASNGLEDQAIHKLDYLDAERSLQEEQAAQVQDQMRRRAAIDHELSALSLKSQQAQDDLANAKPRSVDKFWGDQGVASNIFTGIAVMLGGFDSGSRGGPNTAMQALDRRIDIWKNDQIQKYEAAKDKATLTNNRYKDLLHEYGSPELAATNLQLQANAAKMALIKNHAEQLGTPDALAAAQLALQEAALQQQKLKAQAQMQAGAEVEAKYTLQGGGGGGDIFSRIRKAAEGKKGLDYLQGKTDVNGKLIGGPGDDKLAVRFADGTVRYAGNSKEKNQSQKVVRSATGAIEDIDRLIQLTDSAGSRVMGTDEAERAKTLAGGLTFKAHDAIGVATFQEATKDMMHQMIGNPGSFFRNPGSKAKLLELRRQMEDEVNNQRRFLGKGSHGGGDSGPDLSELPEGTQEIVE